MLGTLRGSLRRLVGRCFVGFHAPAVLRLPAPNLRGMCGKQGRAQRGSFSTGTDGVSAGASDRRFTGWRKTYTQGGEFRLLRLCRSHAGSLSEAALARAASHRSGAEVDCLDIGRFSDRLSVCPAGKVHGSLARAGKVRGQTPKVAKQDKKKQPKGRAMKRIKYNRRFVTAGACSVSAEAHSFLCVMF